MALNRARILALLTRVLGSHEIERGEHNFRCPFCQKRGSDHVGTLHVNLHKNKYICHSCLAQGSNALNIVRDVTGYMPHDADAEKEVALVTTKKKKFLREVRKKLWPSQKEAEIVPLPLPFQRLICPARSEADKIFYAYARWRGLTNDQIDDYGLGYCLEGLFGGYLVFPFYQGGFSVYFSGRDVINGWERAKVRNPEADRRFYLFNYDRAIRKKHLILVEGCIDAIATGPNAMAIMGKTVRKEQVKLINRAHVEEVTVMLDSDARKEVIQTCETLKTYLEATISFVILKKGDPADNRHKLQRLLAKRKEFTFKRQIRFKLNDDRRMHKLPPEVDNSSFAGRIREKLWA